MTVRASCPAVKRFLAAGDVCPSNAGLADAPVTRGSVRHAAGFTSSPDAAERSSCVQGLEICEVLAGVRPGIGHARRPSWQG